MKIRSIIAIIAVSLFAITSQISASAITGKVNLLPIHLQCEMQMEL